MRIYAQITIKKKEKPLNTSQLFEKMKELKLYGMADAYRTNLESSQSGKLTSDELLHYLVESEWHERESRRVKRSLSNAQFRYSAGIEEITFTTTRNLDKNLFMRLADCGFIERKENVIITGMTGVGKSFLACAIGHQACNRKYKVLYFNAKKLFDSLKMSKVDNSYISILKKIEKQNLLIIDDFGLHALDYDTRMMLLEIIEDRHGKNSTIITSQLPVKNWHELFGDATVADAIMDRLVYSSHRIELEGPSMRKLQKESLTKNNKTV